jgi:hypothetical protein
MTSPLFLPEKTNHQAEELKNTPVAFFPQGVDR